MADGTVQQQPAANAYQNLRHDRQRNMPAEQPVPQDAWYYGLSSTLWSQCSGMCQLFRGPWCAFFDGKLEALLRCLCLPCIVLIEAVNEQRSYFKQSGIVYLYLYLTTTVVVNLIVPLRKVVVTDAENIQQYFVLVCIILAIVGMFYLWLYTLETLEYREWNLRAGYPPEALMRVFYQGGLYLFGFSSLGYSISIAIDNITCDKKLAATVNIMKALYIVVQTLFLNKFYKGRIPEDTRWIQIVLAHLLGTNLALWFWTLCSEEVKVLKECTSYPIPLENAKKYFSPLFVEYLLIAASLFYQIWMDLLPTQAVEMPHCRTCAFQINAEHVDAEQRGNEGGGADRIRPDVPRNLGLGVVLGCCFGAVFLVLVIASSASGEDHQIYHVAYSGGIITLYLMQTFACYIILLSAQSLAWERQRRSLDHDDALLYITLVGSLLWEGFHLYSLVLVEINPANEPGSLPPQEVRHIDIAADSLAMLQYVFQTTTLVNLRRHQPTRGRRTTWISQCLLFLLTTNIGVWIENSFFVEIVITTPGEKYTAIQENLKPLGYIFHPLNIFFRFHSAVYCIIAWSIFRN
jgi:hypothetical protein